MDLEKAHDGVDREALRLLFLMYNVGGNLLSGIESVYVDRLACVGG